MGRGFVKVGGAGTDPEDVRLCEEAWEFGRAQMQSGRYDLVILDEINYVISYKMLDAKRWSRRWPRGPSACTSSAPGATRIPSWSKRPTS